MGWRENWHFSQLELSGHGERRGQQDSTALDMAGSQEAVVPGQGGETQQ